MFTFTESDTAPATYSTDRQNYPYYPDNNGVMVKGETYCPGFNLWLVERDGYQFVIEADNKDSALTRMFFRSMGAVREDESMTITLIGPNPRTKEWDAMWDK